MDSQVLFRDKPLHKVIQAPSPPPQQLILMGVKVMSQAVSAQGMMAKVTAMQHVLLTDANRGLCRYSTASN